MENNRTRVLVYNALLIAIVIVLATVPNIGFIQIGTVAITIIHIPVIIAAILFGYKSALLIGLAFGVSSMLVAMSRGAVGDILFINPMVSVVPRIIFALLTSLFYNLLGVIKNDSVRIGATAFVSSLAHSVMVFFAMYLSITMGFAPAFNEWITGGFSGFVILIVASLGVQTIGEALLATIVSIPVVKALRKVIN